MYDSYSNFRFLAHCLRGYIPQWQRRHGWLKRGSWSHCVCNRGAKSRQEAKWGYKPARPASTDLLCLWKSLQPSKQHHYLMTKCPNTWADGDAWFVGFLWYLSFFFFGVLKIKLRSLWHQQACCHAITLPAYIHITWSLILTLLGNYKPRCKEKNWANLESMWWR